jgi:hypothetical protein
MNGRKILYFIILAFCLNGFLLNACSGTGEEGGDTACTATNLTTETTTTNTLGCVLLERDTSSCEASRTAQGLSGFWLKFSCSITLTKSGANVSIATNGTPDYKSYYWGSTNGCFKNFNTAEGRAANPNTLASQTITMSVPFSPAPKSGTKTSTGMGAIGITLNGVVIFNNQAAGTDNIYDEVLTFDECEGHPAGSLYHYHIEPPAITSNDSNFIGVMKDGFPVYGRTDANGTTPTLDSYGGHTGALPDDTDTTLYHYHLDYTTGTDSDGAAASAHFLMGSTYNGTPGTCTGCGGGMGF